MAFEHFHEAQARDQTRAVGELRAGQKVSHWIWYVFPQLRGLGSSSMALRYALPDVASARAYLGDERLRANLVEATRAVHEQLLTRGNDVERLMGSHIDALKLASSLTLFEGVARARDDEELATAAAEILDVMAGQGFPRCAFSSRALRVQGG